MESSVSYEFQNQNVFPFSDSLEIVEIMSVGLDQKEMENLCIPMKDRLLKTLDGLQKNVECMRYNAKRLEDDKDNVLSKIDVLRNSMSLQTLGEVEKSEIENYIDMISQRCQTINVKVHTPRDDAQEESLHKVNTLIDGMVLALRQDPSGMHGRCLAYMRACSTRDEDEVLYAMVKGMQPLTADKGFEAALLGCTLDDQKLVKRRLNGLLDYILKL